MIQVLNVSELIPDYFLRNTKSVLWPYLVNGAVLWTWWLILRLFNDVVLNESLIASNKMRRWIWIMYW